MDMQSNPGIEGNLDEALKRLEGLLEDTKDMERFCMGLGIRLALGMARELRDAKPLGSETGAWVQAWHDEFGVETVDKAVSIAREFLLRPDKLRQAFAEKLGLPKA